MPWYTSASTAWGGLNVVVILDDSGSMSQTMRGNRRVTRMEAAKSALITVLDTLPDDARVGLLLLNGRLEGDAWVTPLGPVDRDRTSALIQSIRPGGLTPLGQFMKIGTDALLAARARDHYGEYRLLLVTDGEASDPQLVEKYLPDIMSRGITVDVIGVDMRSQHSLANRVHSYRRADDPESLTRAVQEVFAETGGDRDESEQSDFELLEDIPFEFAAAAIAALAIPPNQPIGEPAAGFDSVDMLTSDADTAAAKPQPSGNSHDATARGTVPLGQGDDQPAKAARDHAGTLLWVLLILALLLAISTISRANRIAQQRRRR